MKRASTRLPSRYWWRDWRMISVSIRLASQKTRHSRLRSAISSGLMRMSPRETFALRDYLSPELKGRAISDPHYELSLTDSSRVTCLASSVRELSGRSVLLAASGQLLSALAMIEIDGVAARMLLCPPDVNPDHVETLIDEADVDAIVTDQPNRWSDAGVD